MPVTCSRHTYVGHLQCPECKKESQSEVGILRARVSELEEALRDALKSFKCTQRVTDYPESDWSRRACALLSEETEQPGYIAFTRP